MTTLGLVRDKKGDDIIFFEEGSNFESGAFLFGGLALITLNGERILYLILHVLHAENMSELMGMSTSLEV